MISKSDTDAVLALINDTLDQHASVLFVSAVDRLFANPSVEADDPRVDRLVERTLHPNSYGLTWQWDSEKNEWWHQPTPTKYLNTWMDWDWSPEFDEPHGADNYCYNGFIQSSLDAAYSTSAERIAHTEHVNGRMGRLVFARHGRGGFECEREEPTRWDWEGAYEEHEERRRLREERDT